MSAAPQGPQRRTEARFEVKGVAAASLLASEELRVVNLGAAGALVEGALPLPVNAEYRMQLVLEGEIAQVTVKVRRAGFERDRGRYRMGLEFVALGAETRELIERLVAPPADAPAV